MNTHLNLFKLLLCVFYPCIFDRVRSAEEAMKKLRRRKKRRREKEEKKKSKKLGGTSGTGSMATPGSDSDSEVEDVDAGGGFDISRAADELEHMAVIACKHRVKGIAFAPAAVADESARRKRGCVAQLALGLANNSVEVLDVNAEGGHEVCQRVELGGHRADIRSVALSPDDQLLMSASSSALKVRGGWAPNAHHERH